MTALCYDRAMKLAFAMLLAITACGGPHAKPEGAIVPNSEVPETCCCKSSPIAAEDAKPLYETLNRIECSTKQGECVGEVQCVKQAQQ